MLRHIKNQELGNSEQCGGIAERLQQKKNGSAVFRLSTYKSNSEQCGGITERLQ